MKLHYLFLLSLFLPSCNDFYNPGPGVNITPPPIYFPQPPLSSPNQQTSPNQQVTSSPNQTWGVVRCENYSFFYTELKKFLSGLLDPQTINTPVNCLKSRKDLEGGLWITGAVHFENSALFKPSDIDQNLIVSTSSYLEIHVIGINKSVLAVYKMTADHRNSFIEGRFAVLTFTDIRGKVLLDGLVENNRFSGNFKYHIFTNWRGGQGAEGTLGQFTIPACGFFKC